MRRGPWCILVAAVVLPALAVGQDEADEASPAPAEKRLEWSGNLDVKYVLFRTNESSASYTLQFPGGNPSSRFVTQYRLEPYLNADYRTRDLGFTLRTHALYFGEADASADLFEAFATFNASFTTRVQAGKRVYSWGKGYAFNPVGYINPLKDPENPELAQAGLLSANVEHVKSFESGALQTLSLFLVVIPSPATSENRFGELRYTDVALRTSLLVLDTDIDLVGFYGARSSRSLGLDISRNLAENLEAHAEVSYSTNVQKPVITNDLLAWQRGSGMQVLAGIRYLHESNVTLIAEYYHNHFGWDVSEFASYNQSVLSGNAAQNPLRVQQATKAIQSQARGSTLMRDYVYVKLTRPEPFDWLYFTPSVFLIYNVVDKSLLCSATFSYKPVTNIEFVLWPSLVTGSGNSEYGSKAFRQKIELWMRAFF